MIYLLLLLSLFAILLMIKFIKNPVDVLVRIINSLLLLGFCIALFFSLLDNTVNKGIIALLVLFVIWIITIVLNNMRLDKWHKWYSSEDKKYIMRRQIWQRDATNEMYSSFEYSDSTL